MMAMIKKLDVPYFLEVKEVSILCSFFRNYGPTIYAQRIAQTKGCSQCLWLYNDEVTHTSLCT